MDTTSEIDKLKHFHVENYSGTNFTDDLNDGEEFLYTTIRCEDDKELKLAGYGKGEGGPDDWMYQQVIEAVAVFASHGNSGGSAPWEINLVQKLCDWNIISPLRFTDEEWMPKETIYIDCVEVEISPDNWIMSVDADNTDLLILSCNYSIQWKECSCLKGIRLEDVTVELEEEAYEEMRNNK